MGSKGRERMSYPENLRYTRTHEWVLIDGDSALVGITDHAVSQLGDIVFVDLPESGLAVSQGESFGEIESTKTASELNSPLSGEVTEVQEGLADNLEAFKDSPYGDAWMIRIKIQDASEAETLLSAEGYAEFVASEDH